MFQREERAGVLALHQNAQRLLRPLKVVNPYAQELRFLDDKTRTRRDNEKYLTLMDSIALLRQYQRPLKRETRAGTTVEYVEVTREDVDLANTLASQVLGRTLDELPPQTRRFLELMHRWVRGVCDHTAIPQHELRFTRRSLREATGWSYDQVRIHMERLIGYEYVLVHRGMRGQQFVYELLYDGGGSDGARFLMGLISTTATGSLDPQKESLDPSGGGFGPSLEGFWRAIGGSLDPLFDSETPRMDAVNGHSVDKGGGPAHPGGGA
jgi:hypothetical protein